MKKLLKPKTWLFPRPVVLVSARDKSGRDNIITLSWAGIACSEPPMLTVAIRRSRFTHKLISESKEFVVNLPTADQVKIVEFCGTNSGAQVDKFADLSLTKEKASKVNVPMIAECPINLECKVKQVLALGSHDLFVAEIVNVHAEQKLLKSDDEIDDRLLNSLAWQSPHYYGVTFLK